MTEKTYTKIDLKPYYVLGLPLLQLMSLIAVMSLVAALIYNCI